MRVAIVGAGRIGGNAAHLWSRAGHDALICFSRHPDQLAARAAEFGNHVSAAAPADAVATADVVMLAVPWGAIDRALAETGSLVGKVVIDATNQFGAGSKPADGQTVAEFNSARMPGAHYVRGFNTLTAGFQAEASNRAVDERAVLFMCGDHAAAKDVVAKLIEDAGFAPVDLGSNAHAAVMEAPRRPVPCTARSTDSPTPERVPRPCAKAARSHPHLTTDSTEVALMTMEVALQALRQAAAALEQDMPDEQSRQRLGRSVIRPLDQALAQLTGSEGSSTDPTPAPVDGAEAGASAADRALDLASQATRLRVERSDGVPLEVLEAVAGLQDLAIALAPEDTGPRRATLAELQVSLPSTIHTEADGPYLVTNPERLRNWLGVDMPTMPQMALCRCGQSASKPLCDGTHADISFTDAKDPGRVPDRLDTYVGQQVTVHDNRGTCAHSGFCTDRVPTVFQRKADEFVAPSGGRMDEIIRAVRACPSGALSLEVTEHAPQALVDQDREPAIEVSRDGPYRITGGIPLLDDQRNPVARNAGASLEHYSLCRCGHSQNKPFCSGMHWYAEFQDPPLGDEPTLFAWAGGFTALRRMTHIFYETHVPEDPLLAPLFANMSPDHPERVAAWLGETFGGPTLHTETYGGYDRMVSQHLGKALTEDQRARWASLMIQSADEAGLPTDPEFRAAFVSYLEWGTRIAVENSTPGAKPPQHMPVPRWWWVCDATPGSRVSALATDRATGDEEQQPVLPPRPDQEPSFQSHIKPLFRAKDRQAMRFAFDLWSHQDVSQHADAILARLTAGSMPCDGAWPPERIAVFERWIAAGVQP